MTILVTGARGRVARDLVQRLAGAGQKVRAAGRDPRAARLPSEVEVFAADLAEPATLGAALGGGVRKVFLYAERAGLDGAVAQVKAAGAEHVVLLSAIGADPGSGDSIARMHGQAERAVRESGLAWTVVRPGGFATNRLIWAESIRAEGVVRDPFPDSHSALIHETDIAAVAFHALAEPGHEGRTYELTGPESLTQRRQAELIGEAIGGRPVRFEVQSVDDYRRSLGAFGPGVADSVIAHVAAMVDRPAPTTETVREVTGRRARGFAEWAADHAADFSREA